MIPPEILRRVVRKAKEILSPVRPAPHTSDPSPTTASPTTPPNPTTTPDPNPTPSTTAPATEPDPAPLGYSEPGDVADLGVLFMPLAGYHGRELGAIGDALASLGHRVSYLVEQAAIEAIDPHLGDHPKVIARPGYDKHALGTFDGFVAMNDWGEPSRAVYHLARLRNVPSIAKVEGVQDFTDADTGWIRLPYMAADHVLVQGDNDTSALDRKNLHVVGNSNMERAWAQGPASGDRNGEVVINSNFTYGVLTEERDRFLREAIEAIEAAGRRPVISQHPADLGLPAEFAKYRSDRSMSSMLPECEAVVTRFSTVPFEAIAYGTPFVYFNPHFEKVPTFTSPDVAFEHVHTVADLTAALLTAIDNRGTYRTRAEPYFRAQVDIGPTPSAERSAQAIANIIYPS